MIKKMDESNNKPHPKYYDAEMELVDLIDQMKTINSKLSRIQSKYFSDETDSDYYESIWDARGLLVDSMRKLKKIVFVGW